MAIFNCYVSSPEGIYNHYFYELKSQMNSVKNPVLCCFLLEFPYEPVRIQFFDVAHIVP